MVQEVKWTWLTAGGQRPVCEPSWRCFPPTGRCSWLRASPEASDGCESPSSGAVSTEAKSQGTVLSLSSASLRHPTPFAPQGGSRRSTKTQPPESNQEDGIMWKAWGSYHADAFLQFLLLLLSPLQPTALVESYTICESGSCKHAHRVHNHTHTHTCMQGYSGITYMCIV